ncbi:MAG: arsenate reductase ArsC [bacterium]|nr:arsenate reductase ArsC [bacterium]
MKKIKVLFVCIHNSARSQMAEAFLNELGAGKFEAESAGLEPGQLNPIVIEVMKEVDMDISNNTTNSVFDFYKADKKYDYVITVCDEASGERCPVFLGISGRLHWGFTDPSSLKAENKLRQTREIRDEIKAKILEFINQCH